MNDPAPALLTDLYQLTMLQGYFVERLEEPAAFEFFVRRLPANRNFLVAAGLEQTLQFLESFHFSRQELQWLETTGLFRSDFLDHLAQLRFTGDVEAMPEGTLFFADEPILRVTAPVSQAQVLESRVINLLQFQTVVASKAARCVLAAPGRRLVDFGLRRAHGAEAALLAARAAYLAGFDATSNVLAGMRFGIPVSGTMAHSYVQVHETEEAAFLGFARANRKNVTFLLDTYDTEAAAEKAVTLAPRLKAEGLALHAVRLDSGNLAQHARNVRRILDEGGLREVRIFASGNLDEHELQRLVAAGAPIDGFGVGTRVDVSADAPCLDCAYKLQEYAGRPRRKRSEAKATWPGRKQVFRVRGDDGRMRSDLITLANSSEAGQPLLVPVMRGGRRLDPAEPLDETRRRTASQLETLPTELRALESRGSYPVIISDALRRLAAGLDAAHSRRLATASSTGAG
jgi:nicotinate phosphoribosyltransferase